MTNSNNKFMKLKIFILAFLTILLVHSCQNKIDPAKKTGLKARYEMDLDKQTKKRTTSE